MPGKDDTFRPSVAKRRILLVEDEMINREILEMQEPVRLLVQEVGETECTGLIKAAMRCKRLGVSLGRLMMEMSR